MESFSTTTPQPHITDHHNSIFDFQLLREPSAHYDRVFGIFLAIYFLLFFLLQSFTFILLIKYFQYIAYYIHTTSHLVKEGTVKEIKVNCVQFEFFDQNGGSNAALWRQYGWLRVQSCCHHYISLKRFRQRREIKHTLTVFEWHVNEGNASCLRLCQGKG